MKRTVKQFFKTERTLREILKSYIQNLFKFSLVTIATIIATFLAFGIVPIEEALKLFVAIMFAILCGVLYIFGAHFSKRADIMERVAKEVAQRHRESEERNVKLEEKLLECLDGKIELNQEINDLKILLETQRIELNRAFSEMTVIKHKQNAVDKLYERIKRRRERNDNERKTG